MAKSSEEKRPLTNFQKRVGCRISMVASEKRITPLESRVESNWASKDHPFSVVIWKIGKLEVLLHPDEGYIAGMTPSGVSVDARFEKWDFDSVEALENQIVNQFSHFVNGGSSYLPYVR